MAIAFGILEMTCLPMDKRNAEEERLEVLGAVPQADENSLDSQLSLRPANCPSEDQVLVFRVGTPS